MKTYFVFSGICVGFTINFNLLLYFAWPFLYRKIPHHLLVKELQNAWHIISLLALHQSLMETDGLPRTHVHHIHLNKFSGVVLHSLKVARRRIMIYPLFLLTWHLQGVSNSQFWANPSHSNLPLAWVCCKKVIVLPHVELHPLIPNE